MLTPSELDKSLQQLEDSDWGKPGEHDTDLIKNCLRLRRVPVRNLSIRDLQLLIGQNIGLAYLFPLALEHLRKNALVEGIFYPGDLLHSVLTVESAFWRDHRQWQNEVREITSRILTRLHSLRPGDEDYSEVVLEALTEGWKTFQSAPHAL
jgi:hypothetical protein